MAQKSTEPAVKPNAPAAFIQMCNAMAMDATSGDDDFGSPMVGGIVKIMEAEDESEMWDADDLDQTGGKDLVDVEQRILAYTVKYSSNPTIQSVFRDSEGHYMYLLVRSANLSTGEEFVWNTSAPLVVGKIMWLATRSRIPADVVIKAKDLGGGQAVLRLKPIPKRVAEEPAF
jgi:hypothetical protein